MPGSKIAFLGIYTEKFTYSDPSQKKQPGVMFSILTCSNNDMLNKRDLQNSIFWLLCNSIIEFFFLFLIFFSE